MNRDSRYATMQQEFVTGEESIRQIAERHGKAYSSVARMARIEGWGDKREAYRQSLTTQYTEAYAERYSRRLVKISGDYLDTVEKSLEVLRDDLESGRTHPGPSDVVKLLEFARTIAGHPTEKREEKIVGLFGTGGAVDIVRAIEAAARGRLESGPVSGAVEPESGSPSNVRHLQVR